MSEIKFFEATALPDTQKELLCRALLAEFGVTSVNTREPKGEMIHCCVMPWHNETRASASLNYKKLVYRCLGCGAKGGLLWLIATARGTDTNDARSWLSDQTGVGAADFDLRALLDLFDMLYDPAKKVRPPMPRFSPKVLEPWKVIHPLLTDGVPELGIRGRGIPKQNLIDMQVGYAPEYEMGIGVPTSERFVIPNFWKGELVGWQTRRVYDDGSPKYKSSGDFPKDTTIYNYDAKRRKAVVVESPMSVLRHLHHQPMEGTWGAAITDSQVRLLSMHEQIILCLDPDPAGWKATEGWYAEDGTFMPGLIQMLSPYSDVRVWDSNWAVDPAEMDDDLFDDLVANAVPWSIWQRPTELLCIRCKSPHGGDCP